MSRSEPGPEVEIVVPVYNEERVLQASIWRLHDHLTERATFTWRVTIADNASTDGTSRVAAGLAATLPGVRAIRLERKGRGHALKVAWQGSDARVLAYLDVDLSTDLAALEPLVAPLLSGHSDLAIGTRLSRTSRVVRGTKREFVSRTYNTIVRLCLGATFSDAQCGFKAITAGAASRLLPIVRDDAWFFDTELLVLAERSGMRIHEVPVDWEDDPDSRVDIVQTAKDDLRGIGRLATELARHRVPVEAIARELGRGPIGRDARPRFAAQVLRFCVVGGLSTLAFAVLFLVLRPAFGAQAANFLALLITAIANTWANRWFTFGVTGRIGAVRHHVQGLVVFALAWAINGVALLLLHRLAPDATPLLEIVVLTAANVLGTVLRFVLLRSWVFRSRRSAPASDGGPDGQPGGRQDDEPPASGSAPHVLRASTGPLPVPRPPRPGATDRRAAIAAQSEQKETRR